MIAGNKANNSSANINVIRNNLDLRPADTSTNSVFGSLYDVKHTEIARINRALDGHAKSVKRRLEELGLTPPERQNVSQSIIDRVAGVLEGTAPQVGIAEVSPSANGRNATVNGLGANAVAFNNPSVGRNQSLSNTNDRDVSSQLSDALGSGNVQLVNQYCRQILGSHCDEQTKQTQLEAINHAGIPGLYIALKKGHIDCIRAFFDQVQCSNLKVEVKQKLLAPQAPSNHTPGLFLAMQDGYADLACAYCKWILSTNNDDRWKQIQLAAISVGHAYAYRAPALHEAMEKNHSECVNIFCQLVLASNLSVAIKENLITAKHDVWPREPCLYSAFRLGKADSVEAFCQQVLEAELDLSVKHRLLAAKKNGQPIIQRPGTGNEVFQIYRNTIKRSDLPLRTKVSLTSLRVNWLKRTLNPARLFNRW
ncbi:ferrous iron transport protein A [Endozoicomonas sp. ONNA2]|uniref:ferrous iron transport protein A n=1 Tax=Endozoicomonas sp. ONNA2 TaxID=2828741 RepID=UPI0021487458|nr:ferrous iron transport protein A [Endozoicomonas sp. ONNA2]